MPVDLRGAPSWKQRAELDVVICGLGRNLSSEVRRAELELRFSRDRKRAVRERQEEEKKGWRNFKRKQLTESLSL